MIIGNVDIGNKLIMAPLTEITYAPYRKIVKKHGAALTYTQMVSAKGIVSNTFDTLKLLVFAKKEKPIGVQVLGNDAEFVGKAVSELVRIEPDVIDLNCGCSANCVVKHNLGAKICEDQKLLSNLIKAMVIHAEGIPISVKMRLGSNPNKINVIENAKICEEQGASFITVHARFKSNNYKDEASWDLLREVKKSVSIPVVGNGSIFTPQDAIKLKSETGVDSVMIARGALGNPWIFSRYNSILETGIDPGEPTIEEILKTALEHLEMLTNDMGKDRAISKIRKHLIWYFKYHNGIFNFIEKIYKIKDLEDLKNYLIEHTENILANRYGTINRKEIEENFKDKVIFWQN